MLSVSFSELLIVCPLVFLGGFVDAVAGGGGLITLPAYMLAGVPPHLAIGTNKFSSGLSMAASTFRLYRAGYIDLKLAAVPVAGALLGSAVGARIALLVPSAVFQIVLVALLPIAALLVLRKKTLEPDGVAGISPRRQTLLLGLAALGCGAYDGFYGPGAGTFMLILFSSAAKLGVRDAAGQMKMANFSSGLAAFATFAAAGQVNWVLGAAAACLGIAGSYIGAGLVVKNGSRIVRPIIGIVLALLFAKTAWDYCRTGALF